jgi:FMN phosphatase YigB (HAD superfamily)
MKIRAVLFDIYKTLLEVEPPCPDAAERWVALWEKSFAERPALDLAQFGLACEKIIAREHATARVAGIDFPEVYWPDVAREASPELARLTAGQLDDFLYRQACLWHSVRLTPDAPELINALLSNRVVLGLHSNCQPYSLREIDSELARAGLSRSIFRRDLCFFSFEHGFSKPNPHAFRLLAIRLRALGIAPSETLMVGDRLDNDIVPARAQGWLTWLLSPGPAGLNDSGTCRDLLAHLAA